MNPPTINVQDVDTTAPQLNLQYISGENKLDLKQIWADIYGLLDEPGRPCIEEHRTSIPGSDPFVNSFWNAAASLVDYFADFHATDTALMRSIWFHLLDIWQSASPIHLMHDDEDEFPYSPRAKKCEKDYNDTITLIHRLISSRQHTQSADHRDSIIHCPCGDVEGPGGWYETGPFISGLKPWQQFLYSGAPGFRPPSAENEVESEGLVQVKDEPKDEDRDEDTTTRYLPQPAIALVQIHTSRARLLAAKVAEKENWDTAETLSAFDASSIPLPTATNTEATLPSLIHRGKVFSYELVQGAPTVNRHEGLTDPSMLIDDPDFVLLDEAVGNCRGVEAYVSMTGPVGQEGIGFDVWAVREGEEVVGSTPGGLGRVGGLGEMFDEWEFGEDEM